MSDPGSSSAVPDFEALIRRHGLYHHGMVQYSSGRLRLWTGRSRVHLYIAHAYSPNVLQLFRDIESSDIQCVQRKGTRLCISLRSGSIRIACPGEASALALTQAIEYDKTKG